MESKNSPRRALARQREKDALELRKTGATYLQIGERLGVSKIAAYKAVQRALLRLESDIDFDARSLRKLELERLDRATLAIYQQVINGNLGAIDRLCRISELRSKYLQLNERPDDQTAVEEWLDRIRHENDSRTTDG